MMQKERYDPTEVRQDDRPLLVIFFTMRSRSHTAVEFYRALSRDDGPLHTVMFWDGGQMDLNDIINRRLGGRVPDFIMDGFGSVDTSLMNANLIKRLDIKMIRTVGDVETHISSFPRHTHELYCDYLHVPLPDNTPLTDKLKWWVNMVPTQWNAKLIFTPWGVNPICRDMDQDRNIDVGAIFGAYDDWMYHEYRKNMKTYLQNFKRSFGWEVETRNFYENRYVNVLNHCKIALADTGMRGGMTAKYMEIPACGAMLMGEKPDNMDHVFIDGETFVELDYENLEKDMEKKIRYYLDHDDERKRIAKNLQDLVMKEHTITKMAESFEEQLLDGYEQKQFNYPICTVHDGADRNVFMNTGAWFDLPDGGQIRICEGCLMNMLFHYIEEYKRKMNKIGELRDVAYKPVADQGR